MSQSNQLPLKEECSVCSVPLLKVLRFSQNSGLGDVVVIQPSWLLQTIAGTVFSPETFPPPHVRFKDGVITKECFLEDLRRIPVVRGHESMVCRMLLDVGLALENEGKIIAPGRLKPAPRLLGSWQATEGCMIFCGLEFSCQKPRCFSAGVPIRLQCHLHSYFLQVHGHKPDLFRHVINMVPSCAQSRACLVFSPDGLRAWVLVRAPKGCEYDAVYLLRFLKEKLEQEVDVTSPGSRMNMSVSVVSSTSIQRQLSETATGNVLDTYSAAMIAGSQGTEQVTSDTHNYTDHVSDLLFCEKEHFRVLSPMGREEVCGAAEKLDADNLARDLGLSGKKPHSGKAIDVLDFWASSGFKQTLEELEHQLSSAASTQSYSELFDALHAEREWVSEFALNFCSRKFDRFRYCISYCIS